MSRVLRNKPKPVVRYEDEYYPKPKKMRRRRSNKTKKIEMVWVWQFRENDGLYYNFDKSASEQVEDAYQKFVSNPKQVDVVSAKSGTHGSYMIDFRQFTQTNITHENHKIRDVRRHQIPVSDLGKHKGYMK